MKIMKIMKIMKRMKIMKIMKSIVFNKKILLYDKYIYP